MSGAHPSTTTKRYCKCGAHFTFRGTAKGLADWLPLWLDAHSGDGHGPATPAECGRARRKAEQAETQVERY